MEDLGAVFQSEYDRVTKRVINEWNSNLNRLIASGELQKYPKRKGLLQFWFVTVCLETTMECLQKQLFVGLKHRPGEMQDMEPSRRNRISSFDIRL